MFSLEEVGFQLLIGLTLHSSKALVPSTFVYGEDQEDGALTVLVCVLELASWTVGCRPDALLN